MKIKKINLTPEQIFEDIEMGVLLIHNSPPVVYYSNSHAERVLNGRKEIVLDVLFREIETFNQQCRRSDIESAKGEVIGFTIYKLSSDNFLVFLNDVSYKKIYLENIQENKFYDRLSAWIAEAVHEIGNPLTSVLTTLQVLEESIPTWDDEKKISYTRKAITEIERLSRYLGKIRHFSSINEAIHKKHVNLESYIAKIIDLNHEILKRREISVTIDVTPSILVWLDEEAFYQVIFNLILNSLDVLKSHGRILFRLEEKNPFYVKLIYMNDGPPIDKEITEKVFIPFFTTRTEGSGIGLAISNKLMTRMGGSMKIETPDPGWGVKFALFIPVIEDRI